MPVVHPRVELLWGCQLASRSGHLHNTAPGQLHIPRHANSQRKWIYRGKLHVHSKQTLVSVWGR